MSSEFFASFAESNEESYTFYEDWFKIEGCEEFVDGRCFIICLRMSANSSLVFSARFSLGFSGSALAAMALFCWKISANDF